MPDTNTTHMYVGMYIGINIPHKIVRERSREVSKTLGFAKSLIEFWRMCNERLKRNIHRGSFHLTVVSPPEWKAFKDKDSLANQFKNVDKLHFKMGNVGTRSTKSRALVIYLEVSGPLVDEVKRIRLANGLNDEWDPHVTVALRNKGKYGGLLVDEPSDDAVHFVDMCLNPNVSLVGGDIVLMNENGKEEVFTSSV